MGVQKQPAPFLYPTLPTRTSKPVIPPLGEGQVLIRPGTTVGELAELLGQKPFMIIGDLMKLGVFATIHQVIDFKVISQVAKRYGFEAVKAG